MYNRFDNKMLSERIKFTRKVSGYRSQDKFADALHVSRGTVQGWESGKRLPDLDNLIAIADLLDVDLDYLTGRIDYRTHDNKIISEKTWLSEAAVIKLSRTQEGPLIAQTINALIETPAFQHLAAYLNLTDLTRLNIVSKNKDPQTGLTPFETIMLIDSRLGVEGYEIEEETVRSAILNRLKQVLDTLAGTVYQD